MPAPQYRCAAVQCMVRSTVSHAAEASAPVMQDSAAALVPRAIPKFTLLLFVL